MSKGLFPRSADGKVAADIVRNALVISVDGPLTTEAVIVAFKSTIDLAKTLHETGRKWGTIIFVERDADIPPETGDLFLSLVNRLEVIYRNRVGIALVIPAYLPNRTTALALKDKYKNKIGFGLEIFSSYAEASDWLHSVCGIPE